MRREKNRRKKRPLASKIIDVFLLWCISTILRLPFINILRKYMLPKKDNGKEKSTLPHVKYLILYKKLNKTTKTEY